MAGERRYLEWHGSQWRVQVKVPATLRHIIGKSRLVHPLHTSDLLAANERKWPIVSRFQGEISNARRALKKNDPVVIAALSAKMSNLASEEQWEKAKDIGNTQGWDNANKYLEIAKGVSTEVTHELDNFLKFKRNYRPKTEEDARRVVGWLDDWLKDVGEPGYVEDVTRKVAGRFVREKLSSGRSRKKVSAYLGFLRTYWHYLEVEEIASENVWEGQTIPEDARLTHDHEPDNGKRPFTDEEVGRLLSGPAPRYLPDLIRIAALSGMRVEEICRLKVKDCTDGVFKIHIGKTTNAKREVPIHKDLLKLVAKRTANKPQFDYLFHELGEPNEKTDVRSSPASKAFTRYRRAMGVDERPNGKLKSNVDLHSFRRWFAAKAKTGLERANGAYSAWSIGEVLGHDTEMFAALELTMSRYPGPSSITARKACVNAVKLPSLPEAAE